MDTKSELLRLDALCNALPDEDDELGRDVLSLLADPWATWALQILGKNERLRFSELAAELEGISQKMLTKTLRAFERDGIVERTAYAEIPPRVEYALTPLGLDYLAQILPVWHWVLANNRRMKKARTAFDKARTKKV